MYHVSKGAVEITPEGITSFTKNRRTVADFKATNTGHLFVQADPGEGVTIIPMEKDSHYNIDEGAGDFSIPTENDIIAAVRDILERS